MSAGRVCRVCMAANLNLFCVRNELQNVYEKITQERYNKVGYPGHMCYICLTELRKCHRFMDTARDTNNVLKQWYKQQTEMRVARPLYTYSINTSELVSITNNENMTFLSEIKVENVESKQEVQPEYQIYNTDVNIDKIDIDEQTDYSKLFLHNPSDSNYTDNVEQDGDGLIDSLYNNEIDVEERSSLASNLDDHTNIETKIKIISQHDNSTPPIKKRRTNETKLQHQVSETSGETAANNKTSNITSLNSNPSQPDNISHSNLLFDSKRRNEETANLNNFVKTNVNQNKKKRLARNTMKNRNNFNKLSLNTSSIKKHEINTNKVGQHLTRQKISHTNDKPFSCDICSYKSNRKYTLTQHIKTHTGQKPFACDICDYKCIQKGDLVTHMRAHTGEKPFSCDVCVFKCARKGVLKIHNLIHTNEKPFSCNICSFRCARKGVLKAHLQIHTNEKPFSCDICNHKFALKGYLKTHMRIHTNVKPFSCNVCNHKFMKKNDLARHLKTHTTEKPFSCDICKYKCVQKVDLVKHMRAHTGEKPFPCDVCDFKCALKSNLKRHMLIHTNVKHFSCDICDYNCLQSRSLKRHLLTKHANW